MEEKEKTTGVKYIGSKKTLVPFIIKALNTFNISGRAIDVFTGTTRVAQAFKKQGMEVITSDLSWASKCYSNTFIGNRDNTHLQKYIDIANSLSGKEGWLYENYCDNKNNVKVWQKKNGMKADAIRDWIDTLSLEEWEKDTLITSLIIALDKVDNTVGVQQAYLKNWCKRSGNNLTLNLPIGIVGVQGRHYTGDCLILDYPEADLAYLDPPYTAHSYATYYHIWDSIAKWDKPNTSLKTNRREDRCKESFDTDLVSKWNSKKTALEALLNLIDRLPVKHILLSYNDEGIITSNQLMKGLEKYPDREIETIDYKRNIMSSIGNSLINGPAKRNEAVTKNQEYLIYIKK